MSGLIVIGREDFSRAHLKVFRVEEIQGIFGELSDEVLRVVKDTVVLFPPMSAPVEFCGKKVYLPYGVSFASGVELGIPDALYVPALLDGEFLEFLLFDLPKKLDERRRLIVIEDIDQRFTRYSKEGILYALDILERVASTYKVPVLVYGSMSLGDSWRFTRRFTCSGGECFLDGELLCGEPDAQR